MIRPSASVATPGPPLAHAIGRAILEVPVAGIEDLDRRVGHGDRLRHVDVGELDACRVVLGVGGQDDARGVGTFPVQERAARHEDATVRAAARRRGRSGPTRAGRSSATSSPRGRTGRRSRRRPRRRSRHRPRARSRRRGRRTRSPCGRQAARARSATRRTRHRGSPPRRPSPFTRSTSPFARRTSLVPQPNPRCRGRRARCSRRAPTAASPAEGWARGSPAGWERQTARLWPLVPWWASAKEPRRSDPARSRQGAGSPAVPKGSRSPACRAAPRPASRHPPHRLRAGPRWRPGLPGSLASPSSRNP